MKKILCYGDSNTFGYNPETGGRYDKNTRWSGILSYLLKENYEIIEEGMNNRTAFFKNPEGYGIVPPDNFTFLDSRLEATVRELLSQAAATVGEEPAPAQDIK